MENKFLISLVMLLLIMCIVIAEPPQIIDVKSSGNIVDEFNLNEDLIKNNVLRGSVLTQYNKSGYNGRFCERTRDEQGRAGQSTKFIWRDLDYGEKVPEAETQYGHIFYGSDNNCNVIVEIMIDRTYSSFLSYARYDKEDNVIYQTKELPVNDPYPFKEVCSKKDSREFQLKLEDANPDEVRQLYLDYFAKCEMEIDMDKIILLYSKKDAYDIDLEIHLSDRTIFTPEEGLEQDLVDFVEDKPSDFIVPVIFQLKQYISFNERINLLESGLKFYEGGSIVSTIPAGKINEITSLEYVRWIGLYKPSYKYKETPISDEKKVLLFL